MGVEFIHGRTQAIDIPDEVSTRNTDLSIHCIINSRQYGFHLSWNGVGQYYSLTITDDNSDVIKMLLPQYEELYPVNDFDNTRKSLRSAKIGLYSTKNIHGLPTPITMRTGNFIIVHTGELLTS